MKEDFVPPLSLLFLPMMTVCLSVCRRHVTSASVRCQSDIIEGPSPSLPLPLASVFYLHLIPLLLPVASLPFSLFFAYLNSHPVRSSAACRFGMRIRRGPGPNFHSLSLSLSPPDR